MTIRSRAHAPSFHLLPSGASVTTAPSLCARRPHPPPRADNTPPPPHAPKHIPGGFLRLPPGDPPPGDPPPGDLPSGDLPQSLRPPAPQPAVSRPLSTCCPCSPFPSLTTSSAFLGVNPLPLSPRPSSFLGFSLIWKQRLFNVLLRKSTPLSLWTAPDIRDQTCNSLRLPEAPPGVGRGSRKPASPLSGRAANQRDGLRPPLSSNLGRDCRGA